MVPVSVGSSGAFASLTLTLWSGSFILFSKGKEKRDLVM
jgi:hypothetical protein